MEQHTSTSGGGIGIVGLLTIVFVALKLMDIIDWSWAWVLSPLWISAALAGFIILCVLGVIVLVKR